MLKSHIKNCSLHSVTPITAAETVKIDDVLSSVKDLHDRITVPVFPLPLPSLLPLYPAQLGHKMSLSVNFC
jgi:hypothetical protein